MLAVVQLVSGTGSYEYPRLLYTLLSQVEFLSFEVFIELNRALARAEALRGGRELCLGGPTMSSPLIVAVPKKQPLSHGTAARGKLDAVANVTECASHAGGGFSNAQSNRSFGLLPCRTNHNIKLFAAAPVKAAELHRCDARWQDRVVRQAGAREPNPSITEEQ